MLDVYVAATEQLTVHDPVTPRNDEQSPESQGWASQLYLDVVSLKHSAFFSFWR